MSKSRKFIDETLINMFSSAHYRTNAIFYAHMLTQMKIVSSDVVDVAGVRFNVTNYEMYINDENFGKYSLDDRIFIIIHECCHIMFGHVGENGRLEGKDINADLANAAEDCAINQTIRHLKIPEDAITHENLIKGKILKELESSEYYYDLLIKEQKNNKNSSASRGSGKLLDDHDFRKTSKGSKDLQENITGTIIAKAAEKATIDRGNLPMGIEEILEAFKPTKPVINWKNELRHLMGNKKIGRRPTIMRRSRRFPHRKDIKGKVTDRKFTLIVCVDVSGSMGIEEIHKGLNEIHNICKIHNTSMKLIQIDTKIHKVEDFDKNTKLFARAGSGGTKMYPAIEYINENKLEHDALIFISDMYIEDIREWPKQPKCSVMWLATGSCIPDWNGFGKHKIYDMKVS